VVLGYWLRNGIPSLLSTPWGEPSPLHADFNGRVLVLSLGVTVLTGLVFSLAPAWQAMRVEPTTALKQSGRASSRSKPFARRLLIVFQVALSVVILIAAGLFVRTLLNLRSAELGFKPDGILLFNIDPPRTRYAGAPRKVLFTRLEEEIARVPGIESASLSSATLVAGNSSTTRVEVPGRVAPPGNGNAWINDVGDRFFETMGIPILAGRPLGSEDSATSLPVAVINQQFARTFFGEEQPLGRTFLRSGKTVYLVVGICRDTRFSRVNEPMPPTFYRPLAQVEDLNAMTFEVRSMLDPTVLMNGIREAVRAVDPQLPIFDVRTQSEQITATFSRARMFAALTVSFGCLALVLACVGIYGIVANAVNSRVGEIGIRMALGARRIQVKVLILRETAVLAALGVGLGVLTAAWLARYVGTFLYNLTPFDPISAAVAVLLMLSVALLAAWWPARAAARLDPLSALRHD
jgi:predicted permease